MRFVHKLMCLGAVAGLAWSAALAAPSETPSGKHILFIGDSITLHGPAPELGWTGKRGMAASRDELDYVHRLAARFAQTQSAPPRLTVHARGGGTLADKLADAPGIAAQARDADLIIIQLGENDHDVSDAGLRSPYEKLLTLVRAANPSARILCTGVWAPPDGDGAKDAIIRSLCTRHGALFADLAAANRDPLNRALAAGLWTHAGVNWHPSDAGMQAYADAIWGALVENKTPAPSQVASSAPPAPAPSATPLFVSSFADKNTTALNDWHPQIGTLAHTGEGTALEIQSPLADGTVMVRHTLAADAFHGRTVQVSARIRATGLSSPPEPWNGVKVRLDIQDAEGKHDYPQASVPPADDLPWQTVSFTRRIPANTISLALDLGLERVSGVLWVQQATITLLP